MELNASSSVADTTTGQGDIRLSKALQTYAVAQDKVARARLAQDSAITNNFVKPWTTSLNTQIAAATKARQQVKSARLSLDAARAKYKTAPAGQRQEQARLDVEAAEESLVTSTEEAINLMRAVLDNVSCRIPLTKSIADRLSRISPNLSKRCLHSSKHSKSTTPDPPRHCRRSLTRSRRLEWPQRSTIARVEIRCDKNVVCSRSFSWTPITTNNDHY